jgi:hypothetical protein
VSELSVERRETHESGLFDLYKVDRDEEHHLSISVLGGSQGRVEIGVLLPLES